MAKKSAPKLSVLKLEDRVNPVNFGEIGSAIAVVGNIFSGGTGIWSIRNQAEQGAPDIAPFAFGSNNSGGETPIVGDWNGNGRASIGVTKPNVGFRPLIWQLTDDGGATSPTPTGRRFGGLPPSFEYGSPPSLEVPAVGASPYDFAITGDWNNDGIDTVGVYEKVDVAPGAVSHIVRVSLRNSNSAGAPDVQFKIDTLSESTLTLRVVVGDWDGMVSIRLVFINQINQHGTSTIQTRIGRLQIPMSDNFSTGVAIVSILP